MMICFKTNSRCCLSRDVLRREKPNLTLSHHGVLLFSIPGLKASVQSACVIVYVEIPRPQYTPSIHFLSSLICHWAAWRADDGGGGGEGPSLTPGVRQADMSPVHHEANADALQNII